MRGSNILVRSTKYDHGPMMAAVCTQALQCRGFLASSGCIQQEKCFELKKRTTNSKILSLEISDSIDSFLYTVSTKCYLVGNSSQDGYLPNL